MPTRINHKSMPRTYQSHSDMMRLMSNLANIPISDIDKFIRLYFEQIEFLLAKKSKVKTPIGIFYPVAGVKTTKAKDEFSEDVQEFVWKLKFSVKKECETTLTNKMLKK